MTRITLQGNLVNDPELRFTPSGVALASLTIAVNARHFDRQANEWKDGNSSFHRCTIWRDAAENVAASLQRGDAVIAVGVLQQREYETKEGEKRQAWEVNLDAIGPDLRRATAKVTKASRAQVGGGSVSAQADPWASQPQQEQQQATQQAGGWDEPPF